MTAAAQAAMLLSTDPPETAPAPAGDAPDAAPPPGALHLIRAEIRLSDFQRWMGCKRLADPDHAMHCLLAESFGALAPKPFRLITPRGAAAGIFYGYAPADAAALREAAASYADPLHCRIMPPAQVDSKPMPAQWTAGKRLGFEVRIRPVIRKGRGSGHPSSERDAYQIQPAFDKPGELPVDREAIYRQWLARQFAEIGGAAPDLEQTRLVSFQRTRAYRKRGGGPSEGPDALMRGILTITNPAAFPGLLARGLGRHRAYGYGMLLLRPPGPSAGR